MPIDIHGQQPRRRPETFDDRSREHARAGTELDDVRGGAEVESATMASASARELAVTAPTVRGLRRNLLNSSACSFKVVPCDASRMPRSPQCAEFDEQPFRAQRRTVEGRDPQALNIVLES